MGSGDGLLTVRLTGHLGPDEGGKLAGDRDVDDGRALAALDRVVVASVQADLGVPGAVRRFRAGLGAARSVAVVPGGLDEQAAGVAVAGLGDVAAVLLIAGRILARRDPQPTGQLARMREAAKVADLCDEPQRGAGRDAAKRVRAATWSRQGSWAAIFSRRSSSSASWRSTPSRWISICSSAACASGSSSRCP